MRCVPAWLEIRGERQALNGVIEALRRAAGAEHVGSCVMQCVTELDRLVGSYPGSPDVFAALARFHGRFGLASDAARCWRRCMELDPLSAPMAHHAIGNRALADGEFVAAAEEFRASLAAKPDVFPVQISLAEALLGCGEPREALVVLDDVVREHGRSLPALALVGQASLQLHRYDEARAAFDAFDAAAARAVLDRNRGIGGDTIVLLTDGADGADCRMNQFEADGTAAEMTGNGIRCFAWVADQLGFGANDRIVIDTRAGRRTVDLERDPVTGSVESARVAMGEAIFDPEHIPVKGEEIADLHATCGDVTYVGDAVGIGNPHFVLYVDDVDAVPVAAHGPTLEHDPRFPNRTNVHWVQIVSSELVRMRTWERGAGLTQACGTGVTAAVAACHRRGLVGDHVAVDMPGGRLLVDVGSPMYLAGPVEHVFDTDIEVGDLAAWRARVATR